MNSLRRNNWLLAVVALSLLVAIAGCFPSTPEQKFSKQFAESVERNLPGLKASVAGRLEVHVRYPDGHEVTSYLDNAFKEWKADGGDPEKIFAKYRGALAAANASDRPALEPDQVLPVVKNRDYLNSILAMSSDPKKLPVHEAINEELFVFYVQDSESKMRYLAEEDMASVQFSPDVRRTRALENLRKHLTKVERKGGNGIYMLIADGAYEASLMLSDKIWRSEELAVKGETIVAVPARDVLLITGSEDAENLKKLRSIVADTSANGSHLVSEKLFVRRNGTWAIFE